MNAAVRRLVRSNHLSLLEDVAFKAPQLRRLLFELLKFECLIFST